MAFNSLHYAFFLILVVFGYFSLPHRFRWVLLLIGSYYFYMCWKPEYVVLLILSTLIDYFAGLGLGKYTNETVRKWILGVSLGSNLGMLFFFKYWDFFGRNVETFLGSFNLFVHWPATGFLLPVGISFYTFQSMSYTIDVYRGQKTAEPHLGLFALYIVYFPQLVAGPIERSTNLFPQLARTTPVAFDPDRTVDGLRLILWGIVKKVVIADRLGLFVAMAYGNVGLHPPSTSVLAAWFFAIQVYCDFSGYSDIAIGSARIMGVDLMTNFHKIYWSTSVTEYWKRNHISLTTWFRDYLYIPLGGSRKGKLRKYLNVMAIFIVSGFWHGAGWTYVFWGTLNGFYLVYEQITADLRARVTSALHLDRIPRLKAAARMVLTFNLVALGLVFFRSATFDDALTILGRVFTMPWGKPFLGSPANVIYGVLGVALLFAVEYFQRDDRLDRAIGGWHVLGRWGFYSACVLAILMIGVFDGGQFIYFQF